MQWHVTGKKKHEKTCVHTYMTACNKQECIHVIYKPSIGKEDILTACLMMVLSELELCRLVNTFSGQVLTVRCVNPSIFIQLALTTASHTTLVMDDIGFIQHWK